MSYNLGSPSPIQPLSLGNVVSAGLRLYRSHLKSYILLALNAYVWVFVPIYGWAKCAAILALISRLAFGELVNQPESVEGGRRFVNLRLWQFLVMGLLMLAIGIGLVIVLIILFSILAVIFAGVFAASGTSWGTPNPAIFGVILLLSMVLIPILLIFILWIQARFFLVEVPLAVEDNVDGTSTISRSWELTQGHVWRLVAILFVANLITIPIQLPFGIVSAIIEGVLERLASDDPGSAPVYTLLSSLISLITSLASATLVVPFWQAIKAVVYYDLRSRREGLGLKLRDHDI